MIFPAIDIIRLELSNSGPIVDLGNIGEILSNNSNAPNSEIILSLINVEENRISRDPQNYLKNGTEYIKKNPSINLYLTILFTPIRPETGYGRSLESLQKVVEFFQKKYVFDHSNTENLHPNIEKLILEMISLNLEQLHQLWSMLGGKYYPSVAYRMRMITIDSLSFDGIQSIKEIETNYYAK